MVICPICKKTFLSITNTHLKNHNLTVDECKEKFPDYEITSLELRSRQSLANIGKNLGCKRPDQTKRLYESNPMKDPKISEKMKQTRRTNMENGSIDIKQLMDNINTNLPTEREKEVASIFSELHIPLKYVGDGSYFIGRKCPDFINESRKVALELVLNGNNSRKLSNQRRERELYFLQKGWRLIFLMTTNKQHIESWVKPFFDGYKMVKIKKITRKPFPSNRKVYNFECEPNNNYFANRVLVHNCFAYFFKSNNPTSKNNIQLKAINPERLLNAIQGKSKSKMDMLYYEHFYKRKFLLHWGGLADPFCTFERQNKVGLRLLQGLGELNYPTLLSFKGNTIFEEPYLKLFQQFSKQSNFAFQISIVTGDDNLAHQVEIGVPSPTRRLEAIKTLSAMGYWTILRLRPFILGVTNVGLDDLLHRALDAGINGVSMEFFAVDGRANVGMKTRYAWLGKLMGVPKGDLMAYYKATSPRERGGYMRGNRLIKEPYVKQVYRFCVENGLVCGISDPDFKELNTSGSCCGMPDNFPRNRLLQNWTRNQLTYHLKQARITYHKTGQPPELRFNQVYGGEGYLDCKNFANDHVTVIGRMGVNRHELTQRIILQEQWNNLNSPSNPRNYLHGKVLPVGTDEDGNYIYCYNPMVYENEWVSDGIDLTI